MEQNNSGDERPSKPTPDYPLFPHATRRWAKKIKGKMHYFGAWSDPDGALACYNREAKYLHAGKTPPPARSRKRIDKPAKPYPDFPLFAHAVGLWAKKVRGKLIYFGPWSDPDRALALWKAKRDDLLAGRKPAVTDVDDAGEPIIGGSTVKLVCDSFLESKDAKLAEGKIKPQTFDLLLRTCTRVADTFGRNRRADDLRPDDFARLYALFAKTTGIVGTSNEVRRTRSVFKWAFAMRLIDRPADFGPDFRQASTSDLRKHRQQQRAEHGVRMFTADEIRAMLDAATVPMRAMILLGVNAGLGQSDCSDLRTTHIDLDAGTIEYPRPKTGIERRAVLWPETVKALRAALDARPARKGDTPANAVFVTRHGSTWVRATRSQKRADDDKAMTTIDSVSLEFNKLAKGAGAKRRGVSFYSLRRTFETIAGETADQAAVDRVMGHEDAGKMSTRYNQRIGDDRLAAVCEHVRTWLYGKRKTKPAASR